MAKYSNKEIERANRAALLEMANELGVVFDEKLKNAELRELVIKANEEQFESLESEQTEGVETTEEPVVQQHFESIAEPIADPIPEPVVSEQTETVISSSYIKDVMAARRLKNKQLKESINPSVVQAIKARRGNTGVSVSDAIRQRRLGKK